MNGPVYCRECGKEIIFIRTKAGKNMPCNTTLEWYWADPQGPVLIYQKDGSCQKARLSGLPSTRTGSGYVPHWASCAARRQQRERQEERRRQETELERLVRERVERERAERLEREAKAAAKAEAERVRREAEAAQIRLEGF